MQFGLKDLAELPTLKEFEEIGRLALSEPEAEAPAEPAQETATLPLEEPAVEPEAPAEPEASE